MSDNQKLLQLGSFLNTLIFKQKTREEREILECHFNVVVSTIDKIDALESELSQLKQENAELKASRDSVKADAFIAGYETGHNHTVEGCYTDSSSLAGDYVLETTTPGKDNSDGGDL